MLSPMPETGYQPGGAVNVTPNAGIGPPTESVAVQVTVVVPIGNVDPLAGEQAAVPEACRLP